MGFSSGKKEDGIVFGNAYDKYGSDNPVVKYLMHGFHQSLDEFIVRAGVKEFHEVGCGEGYWVLKYADKGFSTRGSDFSTEVISIAKKNAKKHGVSESAFKVESIYDLDPSVDAADLIICCEVLEHLEHPLVGLEKLKEITRDYIILSVPSEPLWRIMNMARLKYLPQLGNTPGHLNHWSARSFTQMVSRYFDVISVSKPLPWTMVLCRAKKAA